MILIVDDNRDAREGLATFLTLEGYKVLTAESGEKALRLLISLTPSAVILDNHMPGLSGREVLSEIKAVENFRDLPVIVFSADRSPETEREFLKLGAKTFIAKGTGWDVRSTTL